MKTINDCLSAVREALARAKELGGAGLLKGYLDEHLVGEEARPQAPFAFWYADGRVEARMMPVAGGGRPVKDRHVLIEEEAFEARRGWRMSSYDMFARMFDDPPRKRPFRFFVCGDNQGRWVYCEGGEGLQLWHDAFFKPGWRVVYPPGADIHPRLPRW